MLSCPKSDKPEDDATPCWPILNLTAVALLAGMKSLEAIAQFARDHGPQLAGLRNAAVHLLEKVTATSKAAATRRFAIRPQEAFPLVTGEYPEN